MKLDDYQNGTLETWSGEDKVMRSILGVSGEAGEVAECVKKHLRGDYGEDVYYDKIKKELGDLLYYVAVCSREHGFNLSEVAQANYDKLKSRKERGVISGSGNER